VKGKIHTSMFLTMIHHELQVLRFMKIYSKVNAQEVQVKTIYMDNIKKYALRNFNETNRIQEEN
jgi:hypothetical protein